MLPWPTLSYLLDYLNMAAPAPDSVVSLSVDEPMLADDLPKAKKPRAPRKKKAKVEGDEEKPKKEKKPKNQKRERDPDATPNKWIQHYMAWRAANPEIVAATKNIGELVRMARESYQPVKKGYACVACGAHNEPPFKAIE